MNLKIWHLNNLLLKFLLLPTLLFLGSLQGLFANCTLPVNSNLPLTPLADPSSQITTQPLAVSLRSSVGTTIYYTLNSHNPSTVSSVYSNPIIITTTTTIRALAFCGNGIPPSPVAVYNYEFNTLRPGIPHDFTNSLDMEFTLVPDMPDGTTFYIGKHEVRQVEWDRIMESNPSKFQGVNRPVERVSWNDAQLFVKRLNEREETTKYRLPTLKEWFHMARSRSHKRYHFGDDPGQLVNYAWFKQLDNTGTDSVGRRFPNTFGVYDVHGNVREWLFDSIPDHPDFHIIVNCGFNSLNYESCFLTTHTAKRSTFINPGLGFRILLDL